MQGTKSRMYPRNLFVYSSYWGTWSRVLRFMQNDVRQVEVNCTAVNQTVGREWERTNKVIIRAHSTVRSSNDKYVAELSKEVTDLMRDHLSEEAFELVVHADLLPNIDWVKYNQIDNGGASYRDILKG